MRIVADLHIHSRYSIATSLRMTVPVIAQWAKRKGIDVVGTGDFTHPVWFQELRRSLVPSKSGIHRYQETKFMLTAEIAIVWSQDGSVRKMHVLVLVPSFGDAEKINRELGRVGNLASNGRPILGCSARQLLEIIWGASDAAEVIPAHIWTPWYSVFGSRSGFDLLDECFGDYLGRVNAVETGLSSDPAMNWRVSQLDGFSLVSNSDAHSPEKLGREATVFDLAEWSYGELVAGLRNESSGRLVETIEFYPQKGKYHYDGHRTCGVCLAPREAMRRSNVCPHCGRQLTVGVMHRVEELANREPGQVLTKRTHKVPYRSILPLQEVISQVLGIGEKTKGVGRAYNRLVEEVGDELSILLEVPKERIAQASSERIAQGVLKARCGELDIEPGYDGSYGRVKIRWSGNK